MTETATNQIERIRNVHTHEVRVACEWVNTVESTQQILDMLGGVIQEFTWYRGCQSESGTRGVPYLEIELVGQEIPKRIFSGFVAAIFEGQWGRPGSVLILGPERLFAKWTFVSAPTEDYCPKCWVPSEETQQAAITATEAMLRARRSPALDVWRFGPMGDLSDT